MSNSVPVRTKARSTYDAAERRRYDAAAATARNEAKQRFDPVTQDNAQECIAWESARLRELLA